MNRLICAIKSLSAFLLVSACKTNKFRKQIRIIEFGLITSTLPLSLWLALHTANRTNFIKLLPAQLSLQPENLFGVAPIYCYFIHEILLFRRCKGKKRRFHDIYLNRFILFQFKAAVPSLLLAKTCALIVFTFHKRFYCSCCRA